MKHYFSLLFTLVLVAGAMAQQVTSYEGTQITPKGAWCWFADARAQHHTNADGTINSTYIGYIDVHGNIKATQHNFLTGKTQEVLIRSYFQPDDHNNPTFLILPDDRVMIFYSRHTDEACFYYRISKQPGDITTLGAEIRLATSHNTTYPSPFILSDDPSGIYLAWRGINWHPTIARLSMPDAQDQVQFTWGPHQIVQSTAARPYAKYSSNGKDKIYMTYTTGHPDNENPNYVYFNTVDINTKQLKDVKGKTLSTVGSAIHNVSATTAYATANPDAVVENSSFRNWVWQSTMDTEGKPVIAIVRISADKLSHHYYYAKWTGTAWQRTFVANGGGKFHQTNGLELCYSGGMAIDDSNPSVLYCSQPIAGANGTVYEIVKYTMGDNGTVLSSEAVTRNSKLNNSRPFVIQNSGNSPLKLSWMNGNYYDWIVSSSRPQGYPTAIHVDYQFPAETVDLAKGLLLYEAFDEQAVGVPAGAIKKAGVSSSVATGTPRAKALTVNGLAGATITEGVLVCQPDEFTSFSLTTTPEFSVSLSPCFYEGAYGGTLLKIGDLKVGLDPSTLKTYVSKGSTTWNSTNVLGTSDVWQTQPRGTGGAWYTPSKLKFFNLTLTYKDGLLTVYRNGLIDQRILVNNLAMNVVELGGFRGWIEDVRVYERAINQHEVKLLTGISTAYTLKPVLLTDIELSQLHVPDTIVSDVVLNPKTTSGTTINWISSNTGVLASNGLVTLPSEPVALTLTATLSGQSRQFEVVVMPRDIAQNLIVDYQFNSADVYTDGSQRMLRDASGKSNNARVMGNAVVNEVLDLTRNTASGFSANGYLIAPEGLLSTLRSSSFLMKINASSLTRQPRLFDFGSASANSVFLRASTFSAGYKYNGAATTLINSSTAIPLSQEVKVAMTFDARTRTTRVYLNGSQTAQSTSIIYEPWQLTAIAADRRNYIGRTQWWDSSVAADNVDFQGTIDDFKVYDIALTADEIVRAQEAPNSSGAISVDSRVHFSNPVQSNQPIHVSVTDPGSSGITRSVELFSISGKSIGSYQFVGSGITLPGISQQGMYFLRVMMPEGMVMSKFLVI